MLSWLNNIYLFGLFLAGIPILIHFLTRKKLSIVKFSAIRFIDEIQKTRMRSLKLKQIILLIIRMLIIACFVIGFARPAIRIQFKSAGGSHERTSVIILLDNSLSTSQEIGGIDIFTLQKNAVHRIISLLKPGDELSLAVFNDDVYPVTSHFTRGFKRVLRVVDTLKVSWKSTSIKNALTFAADELKFASNANREIYIITDNRASGWKDVVPERINFERTRVFVILFNGNIDNLSVSSVSFPPQLIEIDKPFTLNYTVTNHSARAYKAVVSNLFIDNDRVAQDEITSFGAGVVSSELVGYISKGGLHSGYVTIDNDALKADDIYYFSFKVPEICNVLLLGGQERIYLRLALSPTDSSSFFRVKEMDYVEGMKERLDEYDVFVLSAPPPLPDDFMFRLKQSVMSGKGLVLFLGTKSDLKALGNFLQNRISFLGAVGGTGGYLNIGRVLYNHPIFQVFKSLKGIPRVEFYKIVQTIANENVIASFTNDNPFIIETMLGGGKCIVITSSVEPEWSNLYLSSFFIPFIQRSCQYVAGDVAQFDKPYIVGSKGYRFLESTTRGTRLTMRDPDHRTYYLNTKPSGGSLNIILPTLEKPGIYGVYDEDGNIVDMFAVNLIPDESDLTPLDLKSKNNFIIVNGQSERLEQEILTSRFGRELWKTLLFLVFTLMLVEMLVGSQWKIYKE